MLTVLILVSVQKMTAYSFSARPHELNKPNRHISEVILPPLFF